MFWISFMIISIYIAITVYGVQYFILLAMITILYIQGSMISNKPLKVLRLK